MATSNGVRREAPIVPPPSHWPRKPQRISIICPVYNEEQGLRHFTAQLTAVMDGLEVPYEILFVEDDSPDASLELIRELHRQQPAVVKGLSLSRRFGHQASLCAGLRHARGDVVITMDSDMQHPPQLLPLLLWHWAQGYQLVYTLRRSQAGRSSLAEWASRLFYRMMDRCSSIHFEEGTADFRVMDRVVVEALSRFSEQSLLYRGLVNWAGFRRKGVPYDAAQRFTGRSSYTWKRLLRLAIDGLFAFSLLPLRFSYLLGGLSMLFCLAYGAWVVLDRLFSSQPVPGYASLILLVMFMGSSQLFCLGIVGEYIGRIHEQVKGRPNFLVKEWIGFDNSAVGAAWERGTNPLAHFVKDS